MNFKLLNIINYIISISNPISISILKAKYNYKDKTKSILILIKIVVKKATKIIKEIITYKYNII